MNVIIISLDRAKDRREHITKELKKAGIEDYVFYSAFDGNKFNNSLNMKILPPSWGSGRDMKSGEIACLLSHIGAVEMAKTLKWEDVIILEDDIVICSDFKDRIKTLRKMLPSNWEHVFLGGHVYGYKPFIVPSLIPSFKISGAYSFMIKSSAYDKVINKLRTLTTTSDDLYEQLILSKQLKSFIYFPLFVYPLQGYSYIWEEDGKYEEHPSKEVWKDKL
jgi:GR25 family glycosyltransferase involved in LPS biosynthesis